MAITKLPKNAIADDAITSDKIEDGAITSGKLGAGNISLSKTPLGNAAPTISSLDTSQINPDSGATVTITGTGFVSIPDVKFMNTSTGARIQASTVAFTSSTIIAAAFPSGQTPGTYKVLVENTDGKGAISTSTITYSLAPTWSTAANLGSIEEGEAVNIQLLAYDDDSTAVSSYSLVSGSLPSGVTLSGDSSVGSLTGTAPAVDADTNYTFTIRATDDESQTSDREFTLTITNWTVANSLRFNASSDDSLQRSTTAGSQKLFTFSCWFKKSTLGSDSDDQQLFSSWDGSNGILILIDSNDLLQIYSKVGGVVKLNVKSQMVFRDVSAWYNVVVSFNSNTTTLNIYVNGEEITQTVDVAFTDADHEINESGGVNYISSLAGGSSRIWEGYMSEVVLIDGQALDATSFGETDTSSGIWKPKSVSGLTFGTNGFYLPFTNSASLGADSSGNSNDFTVNNLTAIDQTTDTPVNNFATLNPLGTVQLGTLSEGNLKLVSSSAYKIATSTIAVSSGKWYVENKITGGSPDAMLGVIDVQDYQTNSSINYAGDKTNSVGYYKDGRKFIANSASSYGASYTTDDIIGIALDLDSGTKTITFYKNGASQGAINLPTAGSEEWYFLPSPYNATIEVNFGSPSFTISSGNSDANGYGNFEYAVPSGYFALNTKNLAEYG
ncbi:putative Ig domain-containing protein [bacterium]|nr:putative Ig domain-containing protein [bacterium]